MCLSVIAKVNHIYTDENEAIVELNGVKKRVSMGLLSESVKEGDWVLIHTGFAIAKVDEKKAKETIQAYMELEDVND